MKLDEIIQCIGVEQSSSYPEQTFHFFFFLTEVPRCLQLSRCSLFLPFKWGGGLLIWNDWKWNSSWKTFVRVPVGKRIGDRSHSIIVFLLTAFWIRDCLLFLLSATPMENKNLKINWFMTETTSTMAALLYFFFLLPVILIFRDQLLSSSAADQ